MNKTSPGTYHGVMDPAAETALTAFAQEWR